jgi:hypothetical protein
MPYLYLINHPLSLPDTLYLIPQFFDELRFLALWMYSLSRCNNYPPTMWNGVSITQQSDRLIYC